MITLEIDNSYSRIKGLDDVTYNELKRILSYSPAKDQYNARRYGYMTRRCLLEKGGVFPTGLASKIENFLKVRQVPVLKSSKRRLPAYRIDDLKLSSATLPYDEQNAIVAAAANAHRGVIRAATGFGKTYTMALLINKLKVKTLIIVPNLSLKQQLTEAFKEYFGDLKYITIENIDSSNLKNAKDYDCLIIDESHHAAANTYRDLNRNVWNAIYYRFFFTATPFRSDNEENILLESVTGDTIYEVIPKIAISKGYIVPIEAFYIEVPKFRTVSNTWASVYSELVVNNQYRNYLIQKLLFSLHQKGKSTLCLVKEIRHGENLSQDSAFLFANGENEDSKRYIEMFKKNKIRTLIGTTGMLGEGVDTKPAEYVIIAGLGKSKPAFMQQIGRVVRTYPGKTSGKVILFSDPSHKWTKAHFKEQCKILKDEYGIIIKKLDIE